MSTPAQIVLNASKEEAAQLNWTIRTRILTYLSVSKTADVESVVENPLADLGNLHIQIGNLLRSLTHALETANDEPPLGYREALRDLWPWYRERGLAILNQAQQCRRPEDPIVKAIVELRSTIEKSLSTPGR